MFNNSAFFNFYFKLIDYKETDVILYEGLNGKNGIKTIYEKNMPTPGYHNPFDINETSTIIGLLKNKGKFYQRRTTFDTRENIVDNWKSYSKGLKEGEAQWLDRDIWIHTRIQSDPKHITYSVLNQNKYSNTKTGTAFTNIYKGFTNALKNANIENFTFHDLRRTVGTRMLTSGSDIRTVQQQLGHSRVTTTERYTHPDMQERRQAVEKLV